MPDMDVFNERGINLYQLFILLWRKKLRVIFMALAGAAIAFSYTKYMITPQYKANIMFYVNNTNISIGETKLSISQSDLTAAQSLVDTYIVILNTPETKKEIAEKIGANIEGEIVAGAVNSTEIFQVSVTGEDKEKLLKVANAIGDILPKRISDTVDGSDVRIVNHAYVEGMRISPSYSQNTMVGFIGGMLLSIFLILLTEFLDNTVKSEEYLNRQFDLPILAVVPNLKNATNSSKYYQYKKKEIEGEGDSNEPKKNGKRRKSSNRRSNRI